MIFLSGLVVPMPTLPDSKYKLFVKLPFPITWNNIEPSTEPFVVSTTLVIMFAIWLALLAEFLPVKFIVPMTSSFASSVVDLKNLSVPPVASLFVFSIVTTGSSDVDVEIFIASL